MNLINLLQKNIYFNSLETIATNKNCVISTINAHSFCLAKKDLGFAEALINSDVLLPDGSSIVLSSKILSGKKIRKIAGADIHAYLLKQAALKHQKVFYLGASDKTLQKIKTRIQTDFPHVLVDTFSPPFKAIFSDSDNEMMIEKINQFKPDILFVGMTAPKQEKWVYAHKDKIHAHTIVSIGAVFDFYAGSVKRAPAWMINLGMEWLYRLIQEPKRMWRRYLIGNTLFCWYLFKEKIALVFAGPDSQLHGYRKG